MNYPNDLQARIYNGLDTRKGWPLPPDLDTRKGWPFITPTPKAPIVRKGFWARLLKYITGGKRE